MFFLPPTGPHFGEFLANLARHLLLHPNSVQRMRRNLIFFNIVILKLIKINIFLIRAKSIRKIDEKMDENSAENANSSMKIN
jgi:hypothetical protein